MKLGERKHCTRKGTVFGKPRFPVRKVSGASRKNIDYLILLFVSQETRLSQKKGVPCSARLKQDRD